MRFVRVMSRGMKFGRFVWKGGEGVILSSMGRLWFRGCSDLLFKYGNRLIYLLDTCAFCHLKVGGKSRAIHPSPRPQGPILNWLSNDFDSHENLRLLTP